MIAKSSIKALLRKTLPPTRRTTPLASYVRKLRSRAYWLPLDRTDGFFSQDGQDQAIVEILGAKRNGVFLDIGAHDGVSYSNSCYLERELGWTGVCVEPHPDVYARLVSNRSCYCENVAVAVAAGTASFMCVNGYGEMLSRFAASGPSQRVESAVRENGVATQEIEVPCRMVSEILRLRQVDHVDYVSLDIEGGEYDILRTIDLRGLGVEVLTVENNYLDDRIELHLRDLGYRLERILGCDGLYHRIA